MEVLRDIGSGILGIVLLGIACFIIGMGLLFLLVAGKIWTGLIIIAIGCGFVIASKSRIAGRIFIRHR